MIKCDGNHPEPPCGDHECWLSPWPVEIKPVNLPCPFCGGTVDPQGWGGCDAPGEPMKHGPACDDCGATAETLEMWNQRVPTT